VWSPAAPLLVSPSERLILEAIVASGDFPPRVRKRARIILKAAEGLANNRIGKDLSVRRADILHWRERFQLEGIRGIWDVPRSAPQTPIASDVELAIISKVRDERANVLELPRNNKSLRWTVRGLATHFGVSKASVQRILAKHGIQPLLLRGVQYGVDLNKLKICVDPLFPVMISGIAGLFYESTGGTLAFSVVDRPTSEITISELAKQTIQQSVDALIGELRKLDLRQIGNGQPSTAEFIQWLEKIDAKRDTNAHIHLIAGVHFIGAESSRSTRQWLSGNPHFELHFPPLTEACRVWPPWVAKWLRTAISLPPQDDLITDVQDLTEILKGLPDSRVGTIAFA
jgi:hypothetical protein